MLSLFVILLSPLLTSVNGAGYKIISSISSLPTTSYDYVIAGGGLSGLVVANKLASAGKSVLVVEAGGNSVSLDNVNDALLRSSITADQCNWKYTAYEDDGVTAQSTLVDSGKCLGGSTSINGMVFYRPTAAEFDALGALGNPGWSASVLTPYLKQVEKFNAPDSTQVADGATFVSSVRPTTGRVNTSFPQPMRNPATVAAYKKAFQTVYPGIPVSKDLSSRNGSVLANTVYSMWYDAANAVNRRSSAAWAFLFGETKTTLPGTLTVLVNTRVARVNFNSAKQAVGFEIQSSKTGSTTKVTAKKEVILATGALQTAPLLERSGVGSSAVLKSLGVKTVVTLEGVGKGLNDQPGTGLAGLYKDSIGSQSKYIDGNNFFAPIIALPSLNQMFPDTSAAEASNLTATINQRAAAAVNAGAFATLNGAKKVYSVLTDLIVSQQQPIAETVGEAYASDLAYPVFWPLLPYSRGYVHAATTNPFDDPIIVPRFLTDYFDQRVAVTISQRARALFTTSAFAPLIESVYVAGLGVDEEDDDNFDAWLDWYKSTSYGASHWIGSTSMLPQSLGGVVDASLKVYGTTGLRVVDAGVLPLQSTAHLQPYIYTLALRAADLILS